MTTIYLIRHGQAEAGWNMQHDPGLSDAGRQQASEAAHALADRGPLPIIVSPLRRTRETAHELEMKWRRPAVVDGRVAEIPAPGMTLEERGEWLKTLAKRRWDDVGQVVQDWRRAAIQCLLEISQDTVVVTHFMLVNAAVTWAKGDERVVYFNPLPGSRTTLERVGDSFNLVELADAGASRVV
jgi:broad specificity phosphatase PhoE